MCYKRFILERRRWRIVLFSEIIIPVLFVLIGLWITQIKTYYDSPGRVLKTSLYPLPQRIIMNSEPVLNSTVVINNTITYNTTFGDFISVPTLA